MRQVVVRTRLGELRGEEDNGITRFLGIPYAAAPVGPLRFQAPAKVPVWHGVRNALEYGPTPAGAGAGSPHLAIVTDPNIPGDECLNLNVWTADVHGNRPVLVWIPGGANITGSSAQPVFDGMAFARDGVVLVSINYRLGVEGFAYLPDAPANRATLDQIAALEWVRDNIAAFGGDPDQVTVAGSSAGAGAVMTLLSRRTGLFHRAVLQSGLLKAALAPEDATLVSKEIARRAGVVPTAEGFSSVAPEMFATLAHDINTEVSTNPDPALWGTTTVAAAMPFLPVAEGKSPWDAVRAGASDGIRLLAGFTSGELLRLIQGMVPPGTDLAGLGVDADTASRYTASYPRASTVELFAAILGDPMFRLPVYELAESRVDRTFVYEFGWPSPLPGVGAAHALEVGFVFDTLGDGTLEGDAPPQKLADRMHAAWVEFATTGDPGWPAFTEENRQTMLFDEESKVVPAR